jgi:hypothetical protein
MPALHGLSHRGTLTAYVRNVTDERYKTNANVVLVTPPPGPPPPGFVSVDTFASESDPRICWCGSELRVQLEVVGKQNEHCACRGARSAYLLPFHSYAAAMSGMLYALRVASP